MTSDARQEQRGSGWRIVGAILRAIVRIALVVLVGVLIGLGIYYGVAWIQQSVVVPIGENSTRIDALEREMAGFEERFDTRNQALEDRMANLEGELTELRERSGVQEQALATAVAELATVAPQLTELQATVTAQDEALAELQADAEELAASFAAQEALSREQEDVIAEMEATRQAQFSDLSAQIDAIGQEQTNLGGRLILLQAAQDLLRVRLLLTEDNVGLALEALELANEHLTQAATQAPGTSEEIADLVARIESLSALIQERSFRATPTLEAMWADIVALAMSPATTATGGAVTETAAPEELEATPTGTPAPSPTPTPQP